MSTGRFIFRGFAQQGWRAAGRALADSGITPSPQPARDGVAIEYRSRMVTAGQRTRTASIEHRGLIVNGGPWR